MKALLLFVIGIHALIHLMGFVKGFNLAEISQLKQHISKISGVMWLAACVLFLVSAGLLLFKIDFWWMFASAGIVLSQILIIQTWSDAKYGTIANLIILGPVIISCLNFLPSSFQNVYKAEIEKRLVSSPDLSVVTEKDIEHLPPPVQKYLRYVGAVGNPKVHNFRIISSGSMKRSVESGWMEISSRQYNFYDKPARFFYIQSSLFGIPFDGLHAYSGGSATMKIKVASIFSVADAKGEKMNQSENVTMFNDMCLFAPPTLIDKNILWESVDSLTAKAKFTHNGITISALLIFNEKGELINFISDDRYLSADGKTYTNYRWSTPSKDYKDIRGRKIAGFGEAVWHMPGGDFSYARFKAEEIEYNCVSYKY